MKFLSILIRLRADNTATLIRSFVDISITMTRKSMGKIASPLLKAIASTEIGKSNFAGRKDCSLGFCPRILAKSLEPRN